MVRPAGTAVSDHLGAALEVRIMERRSAICEVRSA